jgi:hypothetical protein
LDNTILHGTIAAIGRLTGAQASRLCYGFVLQELLLMAIQTWKVVDHAQNFRIEELTIRPRDVGGKAINLSVRTLRAGWSDGVTVVSVDNGPFSFHVLPTRGMGIWKAWLGAEDLNWQSPVRGPVHPQYVPLSEPSGLGWLDGFDELLVRCGLESNGAPEFDDSGRLKYALHGRIANRPAHLVEIAVDPDTEEITVTGEVDETRFHFLKLRLRTTITTKVGEQGFRLRDEIHNLSQSPAEAQLLYHVNFGRPLLDAGARLVAPVKTVVPRNPRAAEGIASWDSYAAEQPGYAEQVYFLELAADTNRRTQVLLKNAHATRGVSLAFNTQQLPWFTLWKNTTGSADGYVTGLEPGTNFPNPRSFEGEQGRVLKLAPGGKSVFDLQFSAQRSAEQVEQVEKAITALGQGVQTTIHKQPQTGWCAP